MSISIIVDDKLWGLFACHHYGPRTLTFERRSVCELFAQMFSMRLESRERKETVEYERCARDISDQLLGAVASDETLLNDPDWLGDILRNAIPADGVGVWINNTAAFSGIVPAPAEFRQIIETLKQLEDGRVVATDNISTLIPMGSTGDQVAGQAGTVQQVAVEAGQSIAAGAPLAKVIVPDKLEARLQIPEASTEDVTPGLAASIDTRNGVVKGEVVRLDPAAKNGTVTVDVKLVEALPKSARVDQNVEGVIQLARTNDVLFVARPAIGINTMQDAIQAILNGNAYVNIHTQQFPAGEIRGQLAVVK